MFASLRTATARRLSGLVVLFLGAGISACRTTRLPPAPAGSPHADPPAAALAAFGRGLVHDLRGDPASALDDYLLAMEGAPDRAAPYLRAMAAYAEVRRGGGEFELPERIEALAGRHPGESEPLRWLARIHANADRHDTAMVAYTRALRIHPTRVHLHVERLLHLLRYERADALPGAFREAITRTRGAPELAGPAADWLRWAHAEGQAAARTQAIRAIEEIRRIQPRQAEMLTLLAQAYRDVGEHASAHRIFGHARDADPARADTYLHWAFSHIAEGDYAEARRVLRAGAAAAEQPIDLLHLLVEVAIRDSMRLDANACEDDAIAARQEALDAGRRLLESMPKDTYMRIRLADVLLLSGRPDEAVMELRGLSVRDPEFQQKIIRRYIASGAADDAIALLETMAAEQPRETGPAATLADVLASQKLRDRAIEVLTRAIEAGNTDPDLRTRLAVLLVEEKRGEEALAIVREGIELAPGHAGLLELIVYLLIDHAHFEEALGWLDRLNRSTAGEGASTPPNALYLALAKQYTGRTDTAATVLARGLRDDPTLLERFVHFAQRLDGESGGDETTLATLRALERLEPGHAGIPLHRGLYHHLAGRYERAADAYTRAREVAEGNSDDAPGEMNAHFFFLFGAASERSGRYAQSMDLLAEAIRLDPNHADALNYLAYMWSERAMNLEQALDYVRRALAFDPGNAAYIDTLGWIYFQQGRYQEAKIELLRALSKMPDDPTIADHVGDVMLRLNRPEEAVIYWKRALGNTPENPEDLREKLRGQGVDMPEEKTPPDTVEEAPGGVAS